MTTTVETGARPSAVGLLAAMWAMMGFSALLGRALFRLTPIALEPLQDPETAWWQLAVYGASVALMAYSEGYRGFQKSFAPRFAGRARSLAENPTLLRCLLAPMYCMCLFAAPRRRVATSWILIAVIVSLVMLVRLLPQPWRGIVDGGVVVGLAYGLAVTVFFWARAVFGNPSDASGGGEG